MVANRARTLEFRPTGASPDGTYGSAGATYGEPGWTYGQEATDPIETRYTATAYPGWGPRSPDWDYRQWDTSPNMEIALLADDAVPIDYSLIESAQLVLSFTTYGAYVYQPSYTLTVEADRLSRVWETGDLIVPGRYRVIVVCTFASGRTLTIPSQDDSAFMIRDGVHS